MDTNGWEDTIGFDWVGFGLSLLGIYCRWIWIGYDLEKTGRYGTMLEEAAMHWLVASVPQSVGPLVRNSKAHPSPHPGILQHALVHSALAPAVRTSHYFCF